MIYRFVSRSSPLIHNGSFDHNRIENFLTRWSVSVVHPWGWAVLRLSQLVTKNNKDVAPYLKAEMYAMNMKTSRACGLVLLAAAGVLAGCEANGDGPLGSGGASGNGTAPIDSIDPNNPGELPNDGTTPTNVTDGGTPISGNFICERSATAALGTTTVVGSGGLIGGPLTSLLNLLGGSSLTALLNAVKDKDLAIDGNLVTHSTFTLTAGLLTGALNSVDQSVLPPEPIEAGNYAVFGVSFPTGTLDLGLLNTITVTTYLNDVAQESNTLTQPLILDLIGQIGVGGDPAFVGVKATKPYDRATIALAPMVLDVDVGDAMFVHELCTGGRFVQGTP